MILCFMTGHRMALEGCTCLLRRMTLPDGRFRRRGERSVFEAEACNLEYTKNGAPASK